MVASITDICNMALQNIGASRITSVNEGTVAAEECLFRYNPTREETLRVHPWNFATKRLAFNLDVATPVFGYANQFSLPPDCLRFLATQEQIDGLYNSFPDFNGCLTNSLLAMLPLADYTIEGRKFLTNSDAVNGVYIFNQQDTSVFTPDFVTLFAKRLGAAIAYKITGDKNLAVSELNEFNAMLSSARTVDGQEVPIRRMQRSRWLAARI